MKNVIIFSLLILLTACGGSRNFNRQKYTTLNQIEHTIEPEAEIVEEPIDTYTEPVITSNPAQFESTQENVALSSEENARDEEAPAELATLSDSESDVNYEVDIIDQDVLASIVEQEEAPVANTDEPDDENKAEWKSTRKKGWSLVTASLIVLLSILGVVIVLGGINLLLVLGVLLGVILLISGLVLLIKGARQHKEKPQNFYRNKIISWIIMAGIIFGLGMLITILLWTAFPMVMGLILAVLFLGLSFKNYIHLLKERNGDVPPFKKHQVFSLLLFLSTFGFIFLMLVTIPFSQILFALCLLCAVFVFISSFIMFAKAYKGVA